MIAEQPTKRSFGKLLIGGILLVVIAGVLYFLLSAAKDSRTKADSDSRSKEAIVGTQVRVSPVMSSASDRTIAIAGEVRAFTSVTLYAKISGYLKRITVDKGDNVKEGQLLATIESPETDRSYQAAESDAKNKRSISKRSQLLLQQGLISPQEAEQASSNADMAEANLSALAQQRSYELIKAPFSGRVTARFADPGALVQSAANSQSSALPIVTISQTNKLRIYIYLDQRDAVFIKEGDSVSIRLPERPNINILATITRYTGEIDSKTRTLLAEIDLDNKKDLILPGSFVQVALKIKAQPFMTIPSNALIVRGKEFAVAVVDASNTLRMKKIEIADNDGRIVQVVSGLSLGDQVILSVSDALKEGDKVQVIKEAPKK